MTKTMKTKWTEFSKNHPIAKKVLIYGGLAVAFCIEGKIIYEKGLSDGYKDMAETLFHWLHGEFPEEYLKIDGMIRKDPNKISGATLEKYMPEKMKK